MQRVLLATELAFPPHAVRADLHDADLAVVVESDDPATLAPLAVEHAVDLVVALSPGPSTALFEAAGLLATLAPCPFVLFTDDADPARIERASGAGIHAYVVDGYAKRRLTSIVQVARARFRHEQFLRDEIAGLSQRFEERKLVDRAKGVLMRSRGVSEDEAFALLRSLAMRARRRIGLVAQTVIDRSHAAESVNRAGQLRMLSQRLVLCYAQILCGLETTETAQIVGDCLERVAANLGILRKSISASGYREHVERVATSWEPLRLLCIDAPHPDRLARLDAHAETMLDDAEALTDFLEASGLVATLHVINVAGRQRMRGQRIAKLCFLLSLEASPSRLAELRRLIDGFQGALDHLKTLPLSSSAIRQHLETSERAWRRLRLALEAIAEPATLMAVCEASEHLLDASERLTDQYEQAMQLLIGDPLGGNGARG